MAIIVKLLGTLMKEFKVNITLQILGSHFSALSDLLIREGLS